MRLILHVWRQKSPGDTGKMVRYEAGNVNPDMSVLGDARCPDEELLGKGEDPSPSITIAAKESAACADS